MPNDGNISAKTADDFPYCFTQSHRLKRSLFVVTAIFCVAVPGFAALKALAILICWLFLALSCELRMREILWFVSIALNICLCSLIALLGGVVVPDLANHAFRFLLFFLVLGLGVWIARSGAMDALTRDRMILAIAVLSALLKIGILAAVATGRVSFTTVQTSLGFESVTDSIGFGIQRLQFPSDIILIFLLSCYSGLRKSSDLVFLAVATISIFLSFSRYLFIAYALCLLIRFFRVRRLDVISGGAIVTTLLLIGLFSMSLASRFGGQGTQVSDSTRAEQIRYITAAISEHSLLGSGIGSSVQDYKRSDTIPFLYEVQWYAMAMQLGLIGLAWFFFNLFAPLADCLRENRRYFFCVSVSLLWIAGGFTNPFIISLGSAFGFAILVLTVGRPTRRTRGSPKFYRRGT